jgi:hypothetical protein
MVSLHLRPYMSSAGLDGAEIATEKSENVHTRLISSVYLVYTPYPGLSFDEKKNNLRKQRCASVLKSASANELLVFYFLKNIQTPQTAFFLFLATAICKAQVYTSICR